MHDELLMQGMADASGGNYYYVDSPDDMPRIFQQEAGAILRTAARMTDIDLVLPPGIVLEEVIGYDYVTADGHIYVRLGSVPHDQERYIAFRFRGGGGGQVPIGHRVLRPGAARPVRRVVLARLRRRDGRARQLGARAGGPRRGGLGPAGIDGLGRQRQRGVRHLADRLHARHHRDMRERLGPQALADEDKMLLDAQVEPGPQGRRARPRSRS